MSTNIHTSAKIERYQLDSDKLRVFWGDGKESTFGPIWLRMNVRNATRFALDSCEYINSHSPLQMMPEETPIKSVNQVGNALHVDWGAEDEVFEGAWLRSKDRLLSTPGSGIREKHLWDGSFTMPERTYDDVASSDDWIHDLNKYGIVLINGGGPTEADEKIKMVANRVGVLRRRNHPTDLNLFSAAKKSVALDKGYTKEFLSFHSDAPYYGVPPKTLYLCCAAVNEDHIPVSYFVDTFKACHDFREQYPEHYETLTKVRVNFSRYRKGSHQDESEKHGMQYQWDTQAFNPVIRTDEDGDLKTIRIHPRGYAGFPLTTPEEDLRSFSVAYRIFHEICHREEYALSMLLRPGMTVVQDNHRLIHARGKMSDLAERKVFACYNEDYIWESKLRFMLRDKISIDDRWLKGCTLKELDRLACLTPA